MSIIHEIQLDLMTCGLVSLAAKELQGEIDRLKLELVSEKVCQGGVSFPLCPTNNGGMIIQGYPLL